ATVSFHPHLVVSVNQHVGHIWVAQQHLDRAQTDDRVDHRLDELLTGERCLRPGQAPGRLAQPPPLQRSVRSHQLADHSIDQCQGSLHTFRQAATQRLRRGRRPASRAAMVERPGGGRTGPGPGGSEPPPTRCQTAARPSVGARNPGQSGRTGITGNGQSAAPTRSTIAGHDRARIETNSQAAIGSAPPFRRTATPDREGCISTCRGPSSISSTTVRSPGYAGPPWAAGREPTEPDTQPPPLAARSPALTAPASRPPRRPPADPLPRFAGPPLRTGKAVSRHAGDPRRSVRPPCGPPDTPGRRGRD